MALLGDFIVQEEPHGGPSLLEWLLIDTVLENALFVVWVRASISRQGGHRWQHGLLALFVHAETDVHGRIERFLVWGGVFGERRLIGAAWEILERVSHL